MSDFGVLLAQESDNYIEFPKLGLKFEHMARYFSIGKLSIHWYGVIICFAMLLCIILGMRRAASYGISKDDVLDYVIFGIPLGIIGARIYYVLFSLDYYKANPKEIIAIWNGGLAIYGGVIAIFIVLLVATKIKKKSFLHILDFVLPYVMLGQGIGRWGNFINQEAYGTKTSWLFGMTGNLIANEMGEGVTVHPTFLYESLWCIAGFVFIAIYRKKLQKNIGEATALYLAFYGLERALVEGLRTDSLMLNVFGTSIRVSQWLSVALVVVGIALFIDTRIRGKSLKEAIDSYSASLKKADGGSDEEENQEPEKEKTSFGELIRTMEEEKASGEDAEEASEEASEEESEKDGEEASGEEPEDASEEDTEEPEETPEETLEETKDIPEEPEDTPEEQEKTPEDGQKEDK